MKKVVLDEWLWADLAGENQAKHQQESFRLLQQIFERCDQLVTVAGSVFVTKCWKLAKEAHTGVPKKAVKVFRAQFIYNSQKLTQYEESELLPLPEDLRCHVKQKDHYLLQAYLTAKADEIVTTDRPLMEVLNQHNIRYRSREDFLRQYLARQGGS